jgi:hypothetical protein
MDWTGALEPFVRAGGETQDIAGFARALKRVPPDWWGVVHLRMRVALDAVQLGAPAEDVEGRNITGGTVVSEDLLEQHDALDGKKKALREENAERAKGETRPA